MNWDAIGALGEILGATAVLATLLYLARQVRENTRSVRVQTDASISEGYRRVDEASLANPELAAIRRKVLDDEPLTPEEELKLQAHTSIYINARYVHWKAHT